MENREKKGGLTPIEKLTEFYKKNRENKQNRNKECTVELGDNTVIKIYKLTNPNQHVKLAYRVDVGLKKPPEDEKKVVIDKDITFYIDMSGLSKLYLPSESLKIGETSIELDSFAQNAELSIPRQSCIPAAETLVDWLGNMVKANSYIQPPISVSIPR